MQQMQRIQHSELAPIIQHALRIHARTALLPPVLHNITQEVSDALCVLGYTKSNRVEKKRGVGLPSP